MQASNSRTGYALTVSAGLVWATTSILIKYLLDHYGVYPLAVAFWRDLFIALTCIVGLLVLRPRLLRVNWRDLRGFALFGTISIGVYHALWVTSIALNGAAVGTVLVYTFPTFVTIGAWLIFHEPIRKSQIAALILALLGCALLVRAYDSAVLQVNWIGALVGIASGVAHASYVLFSQRSMRSHSSWTSLSYMMLFGSITLLLITLGSAPQQIFSAGGTAAPWLMLLLLALGPTLGGYALFTAALRHIPGRIASLIVIIEAPISSLLAVWLLHEHLEWPQLIGLVFILTAIMLPRLLMQHDVLQLPEVSLQVPRIDAGYDS
jgi:drug/metabolite transporter (DMT)-like permease